MPNWMLAAEPSLQHGTKVSTTQAHLCQICTLDGVLMGYAACDIAEMAL